MKQMTDERRAACMAAFLDEVRAENTPDRRAARYAGRLALEMRRSVTHHRDMALADHAVLCDKHGQDFPLMWDGKVYGRAPGDFDANAPYAVNGTNREASI